MATSKESNYIVRLDDPIKRVMTFVEARENIASTFAMYHQLLCKREAELIEKLFT